MGKDSLPELLGQAGCTAPRPPQGSGRGAWPLRCHVRGQQEGHSLSPQGAECGWRPVWALSGLRVVSGSKCGYSSSAYSPREPSQLFAKLRKIHKVKPSLKT